MKIGWKFFLTLFLGLGCALNAKLHWGIDSEEFSNFDKVHNIFLMIVLIPLSLVILFKKKVHTHFLAMFCFFAIHLMVKGGMIPDSLRVTMFLLSSVVLFAWIVSGLKAIIRFSKKSKNKQQESQV